MVAAMRLGLSWTDVCNMSYPMLTNMFVAEDDFRATRKKPTKEADGEDEEVREATPEEIRAWM